MLYRRFHIKTDDPLTMEKAERVIKEKNLSREDLILLLSAIELNDNLKFPEVHAPEFDSGVPSQPILNATDS